MRYPLLVILSATLLPLAAEDRMLSGAHLSYTALFNGEIKTDGQTNDWDNGYRVDLHLRDYYFPQQSHHPFAEIGFFYEVHEASSEAIEVDAETIAFRVALGSAIPLWSSVDGVMSLGVAPELGAHIGTFSVDTRVAGDHSEDDSFRYGASAGISGWFSYNRSVSFGLGLIGSYWRATEVNVTVPDGLGQGGTKELGTNPQGWDLGVRFSVGFLF